MEEKRYEIKYRLRGNKNDVPVSTTYIGDNIVDAYRGARNDLGDKFVIVGIKREWI